MICGKHEWSKCTRYVSVGYSDDIKICKEGRYKLPYIVYKCLDCGFLFIMDEAANMFVYGGRIYDF